MFSSLRLKQITETQHLSSLHIPNRDVRAPGSIHISSKEDGWSLKNIHLKLALNIAKPVMEQKNCLYLNCYQHPVHTVYKQNTGELTSLICQDKIMSGNNQTMMSQFLLLGLPIPPEQHNLFYALFLAMYLTTILGNLIIIVLILLDSHLHTPMYLFLSNLSFSDLCFSSVTMPKLLQNMQSQDPSISYVGCLTQMYFLMFFGDMESFLLVVMAYDRYVAICFPLHYSSIMSPKLCACLLLPLWMLATSNAMMHTLLMARLSFCENNVIPHFFCDSLALLKLACTDTYINDLMIFIMSGLIGIAPFLLIVMSYARIVFSIVKVHSTQGIHKLFSTCGSHLSVVSLFYGTVIGVYVCPSGDNSTVKETTMAMMYTVVTPMLNPFIYSLRNKDIKGALIKVIYRKKIS
ncbi:olfactory receptor [Cricetulus griseus]|uniref:Olfactory receptor n=2 Tax=Cricetulus griseus TaxID=10029 RepID=A0A061HW66_CRIGR|nr:olfactory receptor [Cricetulus griseus]